MIQNILKTASLWITSLLLMGAFAVYQRSTGPTYPIKGKVEIQNQTVKYKLIRTHDTGHDALVKIAVPEGVKANFRFKRFKSHDQWTTQELFAKDGFITAAIPHQPAAGKVEYQLALIDGEKAFPLTEEPVVIRFKGSVPGYILIPHIFFMFFAMVVGIRTTFESIFNRRYPFQLASVTVALLFIGGLILGPIVQKYAFDAYWTGWPWGHDLTDNKTIIMFLFWLFAWWKLRQQPSNKTWPIVAAVVMVAVYLIPHSMLGSEIDHTKNSPQTEVTQ